MASIFDKIYEKSPIWFQNLGISLYGLIWRQRRWGGEFKSLIHEFTKREEFTLSQWLDYQNLQLQKVLNAAWNTPYYQLAFTEKGLTQELTSKFTCIDLGKLPLVDKQSMRLNSEQFTSRKMRLRKLHAYWTSGTTGTPIKILMSNKTHRAISAAYEARVRSWAGVNYHMSRAMIGGRMVVPEANAKAPFWRYNLAEKQLYMSAFHISPTNVPNYARALNDFQPDYLVGYASSHYFLARMLDELKIEMYQPKAVLTSSEKLTPEMRATIQKVYHCEVFDAYSGVEACCQASECEHHRLHISPDMGIVEFLGDDDQPVPAGVPGRIVATGLLNFAQPLIRYETGDIGILSTESCLCGRQMPVIEELVGRLEDTVVTRDGKETVRFHGIFIGLENVCEGQVIQEDYDCFTVRLVVRPAFNDIDKKLIRDRFKQRLGEIKLEFEIVDQIERTERGKFKAVVSRVQRKSG